MVLVGIIICPSGLTSKCVCICLCIYLYASCITFGKYRLTWFLEALSSNLGIISLSFPSPLASLPIRCWSPPLCYSISRLIPSPPPPPQPPTQTFSPATGPIYLPAFCRNLNRIQNLNIWGKGRLQWDEGIVRLWVKAEDWTCKLTPLDIASHGLKTGSES